MGPVFSGVSAESGGGRPPRQRSTSVRTPLQADGRGRAAGWLTLQAGSSPAGPGRPSSASSPLSPLPGQSAAPPDRCSRRMRIQRECRLVAIGRLRATQCHGSRLWIPRASVTTGRGGRPGAAAVALPEVIVEAGPAAGERFLEFFGGPRSPTAGRGPRPGQAAGRFLAWCASRGLAACARSRAAPRGGLHLDTSGSAPTLKQHLAAVPVSNRRGRGGGTETASSAESVGEFWFGQVAKCVIQSDFQCPGGAEPIRPFGDHSGLSVEAFDNATGELPPGSEPVQNQVAVRAQPCGQPPSSGRAASASSGCTSGRGTGRPSTATRSPTAIESPP